VHPIVLLLIAGAGGYFLYDAMEEEPPEVQGLKNKDGDTIVVPTRAHHSRPRTSLTDVPPPADNGPQAIVDPPPYRPGSALHPKAPALITRTGATNMSMQSVEDLQRAANALGFGPVEITGSLDGRTRAALSALGRTLGLPPQDVVGLPMRKAVEGALATRAAPRPTSSYPIVQSATPKSAHRLTDGASQLPVTDVVSMQRALNALGASPKLKLDGIIGQKTTAAIKAFQISQGLVADGIAGPKTITALQAAVDPKTANTIYA
jgi:peptidoglycan hydrolase-like protein with peptidoglycan-binding domain